MGKSESKSGDDETRTEASDDIVKKLLEEILEFFDEYIPPGNGDGSTLAYRIRDIERMKRKIFDVKERIQRNMQDGNVEESDPSAVGILNPFQTTAVENFITSFRTWLPEGVELKCRDDISENDTHTFVVCNDPSSLVPVINKTFSKAKSKQWNKVMVIVLHTKPKGQLTARESEKVLQENNECKEVKYVVDMAYTGADKIYACDMNTKSHGKIKIFLQTGKEKDIKDFHEAVETDNGDSSRTLLYQTVDEEGIQNDEANFRERIQGNLQGGNVNGPDPHTVGILDPLPTPATETFITSLQTWLPKGVELKCLKNTSEIDTHTFVVCNNSSRLVTDINATLSEVKSKHWNKMMVIVLHTKSKEQLPVMETKKVLQDNKDYEEIKYVVDMAYTRTDKIYPCDMNTKAHKKLGKFLRTCAMKNTNENEANDNVVKMDDRQLDISNKLSRSLTESKPEQKSHHRHLDRTCSWPQSAPHAQEVSPAKDGFTTKFI